MQASAPASHSSSPKVSWLVTAATYGLTIAALAAFALLGVEESRVLLIG